MAEENELPPEIAENYLPYATEYMNSACYCLEVLNGIDGKLFSKSEEKKLNHAKNQMLQVIYKAADELHGDYVGD
jgi:hypothetical protein